MQQTTYVGFGAFALGIGAAAVSILGPIGLDVIAWRVAGATENQIVGQDLITLLLAAPFALVAGVLWLRRHQLAPVLTLGPAVYSLYTFLSYILSPDYHRYPGNNEAAFPLLLAIVILSWLLAVAAWRALDTDRVPPIPSQIRLALGVSLLLMSGLFVFAWSAQVVDVIRGTSTLAEYQDAPGTFWVIKTFDLAFVMPIAIATGVALIRNRMWAIRLTYGVSGFFILMSAAVASMGITMLVRDDPSATVVLPVVTATMTFVIAGLVVALIRAHWCAETGSGAITQPL